MQFVSLICHGNKIFITLSTDPGNPYWRERISTIDLLVLTSSDQGVFIWIFFNETPILMRRSTVPSLPVQQGLPGSIYFTHYTAVLIPTKNFSKHFLTDPLQANPYETSNVASALDRALKMPLEERQLRMFQLKKRERRMDVDAWCQGYKLFFSSSLNLRLEGPYNNPWGVLDKKLVACIIKLLRS
jgi:hypothetical protein